MRIVLPKRRVEFSEKGKAKPCAGAADVKVQRVAQKHKILNL